MGLNMFRVLLCLFLGALMTVFCVVIMVMFIVLIYLAIARIYAIVKKRYDTSKVEE